MQCSYEKNAGKWNEVSLCILKMNNIWHLKLNEKWDRKSCIWYFAISALSMCKEIADRYLHIKILNRKIKHHIKTNFLPINYRETRTVTETKLILEYTALYWSLESGIFYKILKEK